MEYGNLLRSPRLYLPETTAHARGLREISGRNRSLWFICLRRWSLSVLRGTVRRLAWKRIAPIVSRAHQDDFAVRGEALHPRQCCPTCLLYTSPSPRDGL